MASTSIHQAVHGYRDGHRLLSSSITLGPDAARTMLVLSDMSGPSMHPGFEQYLTAYPLPGTEFFVFAKTWYAPEMQRPGCVWTHSLLIPRTDVADISTTILLANFQRPQAESTEGSATAPVIIELDAHRDQAAGWSRDKAAAGALVGAVFGQPLPVIVAVESAVQLESTFLHLWETLWPAERVRFAFCTGALMPRSIGGLLMDLQAVPRAVPPSQFRKSASGAHLLDLRAPSRIESWVEFLLEGDAKGDALGAWLEAVIGAGAGRSCVPGLVPIFMAWHSPTWSAHIMLKSTFDADLEPNARSRLIGMVLNRAGAEEGASRRRELLQDLCSIRNSNLTSMAALLEEQARQLFEESRVEGCSLVLSLLGAELGEHGERLLRASVLLLVPEDVETFGDGQAPFLPTIVRANPMLARSPVLWQRVGSRATEVLSQLNSASLSDGDRCGIIEAILTLGREVPVDPLVRFGGRVALRQALAALSDNRLQLSWQWRSALSAQPDAVLDWLEGHPSLRSHELELGTRLLNPKANLARLARVWQNGTTREAGRHSPRVAAFGLALALAEGNAESPLLAACFQPTYDAASGSRLEYEEWDWLREQAPAVSWWRDWDRCERLAAALARLLGKQEPPLEIVFAIVRSRHAIKKVASLLDDNRETRAYLKLLRKTAEASLTGTPEQQDALLMYW